jgi:CSLREA domain-containing protein
MRRAAFIRAISTILFLAFGAAHGATFIVTKTADTNDGACAADCSLREAMIAVNSNIPGGVTHRIEFSALFDTPRTIVLNQGQLLLTSALSQFQYTEIRGKGASRLTNDGGRVQCAVAFS